MIPEDLDGWQEESTGGASPLLDFSRTDYGNAERLVHQYRGRIRYCPDFKKWLVWDGKRWALDGGDRVKLLMVAAAKRTAAKALFSNSMDRERRESVIKWCLASEGDQKTTAALNMTKGMVLVPASDLDQNPYLLNFQNGTLDLRDGTLRGHDPKDTMTKCLQHDYQPEAECPCWLQFLREAMGVELEGRAGTAEAMVGYLQAALGYSLTGMTSEKAVFLLHGVRDNGKTTLLSTFSDLLSPDYSALVQVRSLTTKASDANAMADLANLRGARFAMTSETEAGQRFSEGQIKRITQGVLKSRISATRKYENPISFIETHKLWIDANHLPVVDSSDEAVWRRLVPVPFDWIVPRDRMDRELPWKLAAEAKGILAWAVEGAMRWHREGLGKPPQVEQASRQWREEMDVVGSFLKECCVVGAGRWVEVAILWERFSGWLVDYGGGIEVGRRQFNLRLRDMGCEEKPKKVGERVFRAWFGVGLV